MSRTDDNSLDDRLRTLEVAVIIPALNEEHAIGRVLNAIPDWVSRVVVVDNGSTDHTAAVARQGGAKVVHAPRRGYGSACLAGIKAMDRPDIVVFLDGDFSDRPEEMDRLVQPIARGEADMVIGSRTLGLAQPGALTLPQRIGNSLACALMRLLYRVRYTDLGPFRAIGYDALRRLRMDDPDYGWTVQMQIRAARQRLRTVEAPVSYRRRIGQSKISGTLRGAIGAGYTILRVTIGEWYRGGTVQLSRGRERIIIFTRYARPGFTKTRLMPLLGPNGAAILHQQFIRMTLDTAQRLWARRMVRREVRYTGARKREMARMFGRQVDYFEQGEGDLGHRLARATTEAFENGDDRVIIIGTDCPLLTAELLDQAFEALDKHDVVLGPAQDGGYYLIGMRANHPELFIGIAWGGPQVLAQTLAACRQRGLGYALLPSLADVDTPDDLSAWASTRLAPANRRPRLSVIIPARDEQDHLAATIASALAAEDVEIIVADGASTDRTTAIARRFGVTTVESQPPRARQMNAAAERACGDILLFLHADTLLPVDYAVLVREALSQSNVAAGAFRLRIDAEGLPYRLVELAANLRSRALQLPYGDQALFFRRDLFMKAGGFPVLPVMEDYALMRKLRRRGRIPIVGDYVRTSARRWQRKGAWKTTLAHQRMIAGYHLGVCPGRLATWR